MPVVSYIDEPSLNKPYEADKTEVKIKDKAISDLIKNIKPPYRLAIPQ